MPVLDGIAAAERIAGARLAPVVMLTAFSQRDLVERAREAGAMAYLVKPFGKHDLVPAIEMAVSRYAELTDLEREVTDLTERLEARKAVDRAKVELQRTLGPQRARRVPVDPEDRDGPAAEHAAGRRRGSRARPWHRRRKSVTISDRWADTPRNRERLVFAPAGTPTLPVRAGRRAAEGGHAVTTRAMDRSVIRGVAALLMGLVLAPFVVLLMTSSAEAAPTLCLPQRDERSCVAGTIGTRAEPYAGVDVTLVAPDGSEETVTSADTGRWSFEVTEPGVYEVSIDESQLPEGIELIPPAGAQAGSTAGSFKVDVPELGIAKAVLFQVRSEDFDASS